MFWIIASVLLNKGSGLCYFHRSERATSLNSNSIMLLFNSKAMDNYSDSDMNCPDESDIAWLEETSMKFSSCLEFNEINNISIDNFREELLLQGVARINNLLTTTQSDDLLAFIKEELISSIEEIEEIRLSNDRFALSKSQSNRWDLKLPFNEIIKRTMSILLSNGSLLGDSLHSIVGDDAKIVELAAFVTIKGAGRQIIHSDTFWSVVPSRFTCTVALQDIDDELMGPTVFIPKTHTAEAYLLRAQEFMEEDADKASELLKLPHTLSLLKTGCGAVYDSRLLHCGGANRSEKPRVLFYFTVSNPKAEESDSLYDPEGCLHDISEQEQSDVASIRRETKGITLGDFRIKVNQ